MQTSAMIKLLLKYLFLSASGYILLSYILEFLFGPRLGHVLEDSSRNFHLPLAKTIVERYGYTFEEHEVVTPEGYILSLHRIPTGRISESSNISRPVALFQHGLLSASDAWLFRGPKKDLLYMLSDAGYDVWIVNMRGNHYSRKHKTLNSNSDAEYWEFGLHEVGQVDLATIIDYILNHTKRKNLHFLGHSVGSSALFILCSQRPEYNAKIKLHVSLAPLTYVTHHIGLVHRIFLTAVDAIGVTLKYQNIHEMLPRRQQIAKLAEIVCQDGIPTQHLCIMSLFSVVGSSYEQLNTSTIPISFSYYPAGTSLYLFRNAMEIYASGEFSTYDYGDEALNLKHYNSTKPIHYDLSKVTHPVSLHYGRSDLIVTEEDIDLLENKLQNVVGKFLVPLKSFNHMDFMWGNNAKKLVYDKIIVLMNKYR